MGVALTESVGGDVYDSEVGRGGEQHAQTARPAQRGGGGKGEESKEEGTCSSS